MRKEKAILGTWDQISRNDVYLVGQGNWAAGPAWCRFREDEVPFQPAIVRDTGNYSYPQGGYEEEYVQWLRGDAIGEAAAIYFM